MCGFVLKMGRLQVLNLTGNPVIRKTTQYRKTLITSIADLHYLDDRPVFPKERICAVAFMAGVSVAPSWLNSGV